jgi:antitoxin VapB
MMPTRQVKLFRNNQSQAVRIPRDWELPGSEAVMTRDGNRLILEPTPRKSLLELLDSWDDLEPEEAMPPIGRHSPRPVEL